CVVCRRGARADRGDRGGPSANVVALPVGLVVPHRLQLRLSRLVHAGGRRGRACLLQLRIRESRLGGPLRRQRLLQGRNLLGPPHLLDLWARGEEFVSIDPYPDATPKG